MRRRRDAIVSNSGEGAFTRLSSGTPIRPLSLALLPVFASLSFAARSLFGIGAAIVFAVLLVRTGSEAGSLTASTKPVAAGTVTAAGASAVAPASFYSAPFEKQASAAALTALGRVLFSEAALSASGRMSCASCHDPARAYGPPDARSVRLGGRDGAAAGVRAVPSLR